MKKTQPASIFLHGKIEFDVVLREWNVFTFTNMPSRLRFIVLLGFVAPLTFTHGLPGEGTARTCPPLLLLVAWSRSQTFSRTAGCFVLRCRDLPPGEVTGGHQRFAHVHVLALSPAQPAAGVSVVQVHFDDQRFL